MEANTSIGDLTICKNIALLHMREHSLIGRGNWITGFPLGPSPHFASETDRRPELIIGEHSAITHRHLIDCTNSITIGRFTTFAGFQSQMLTHSIDVEHSRQASAPIRIGDYCFVGTNSVLLGGSALPDYSVLGAKSLLNKAFTETHHLYGGVPGETASARCRATTPTSTARPASSSSCEDSPDGANARRAHRRCRARRDPPERSARAGWA
jgi:carbonic anhydrase/acetyltransferase-like protein (isoleucine patch superfamily)